MFLRGVLERGGGGRYNNARKNSITPEKDRRKQRLYTTFHIISRGALVWLMSFVLEFSRTGSSLNGHCVGVHLVGHAAEGGTRKKGEPLAARPPFLT